MKINRITYGIACRVPVGHCVLVIIVSLISTYSVCASLVGTFSGMVNRNNNNYYNNHHGVTI